MKNKIIFSFLMVLLILVPSLSFSAVYKWVDENGKVWITDYPGTEKETEEKEVAPAPEEIQKSQPEKVQAGTPTKQVTVQKSAPASAPVPVSKTAQKEAGPKTSPLQIPVSPATKQAEPLPRNNAPLPEQAPLPTRVGQADSPKPLPPLNLPKGMPKYPGMDKQIPELPAFVPALLAGGFAGIFLITFLVFYIYICLCMYLIAKKLQVEMAWLSWVPVFQVLPFLRSAGKPCWWVLMLCIPILSFFIYIYLWMCITENLGRNKWLGLLILVPVINLVYPGILAFTRSESYSPGLSAA